MKIRIPLLTAAAPAAAALALAAAAPAAASDAQARKLERAAGGARPAAELRRIMARIARQTPPAESRDKPPELAPEPFQLALVLPELIATVERAIPRAPTAAHAPLHSAAGAFARARQALQAGGRDATHLRQVLMAMAEGEQALGLAAQVAPAVPALLVPAVQSAREAARRSSRGVIDLAVRLGAAAATVAAAHAAWLRGDALFTAGAFAPAIVAWGDGLGLAAGTVVFSVDRFEQNIRSLFDPLTVGYAYAINQGGVLARSGFNGLARTAADAPATLQSPTRKMHVASISKTLTAIVTLRLLADKGLTPDEPIGPWLPSHWQRGAGVDALTFRQLMTHSSGFEQNQVAGSSYPNLQAVIAKDVGDTSYQYNNANFGILRVLVAGLMGIDAAQFGEFDGGTLTASAFLLEAQQRYGNIGVSFTCDPAPANQTIVYKFPDAGVAGYQHQPKSHVCGGFGAFMSAQDLAQVLAFWRYTSELLTPALRQAMTEGYLGLLPPSRYGWGTGVFGEYPNHGGDWSKSLNGKSGGLDTCMMAFPIDVEAAVVINSIGPDYAPVKHQCTALRWAFENAWVAQ